MRRIVGLPLPVVASAFVALILLSSLALWFCQREIDSYRANHERIFKNEVTSSAAFVQRFLEDRSRLVETFATEKSAQLNALAADPTDDALRAEITDSLERWFPSYFTFTLADADGNDLIEDIDGFVGDVCLASIENFLVSRKLSESVATGAFLGHGFLPEIHPQPGNYHFDLMARWNRPDAEPGVFFVSFYPSIFQKILASFESEGHKLALINRHRDGLIEVTADGARDSFGAYRDIYLYDRERNAILARQDVPFSHWEIVGYPEAGFFEKFEGRQWRSTLLLVLGMSVVTLIGLRILGLSERRRMKGEEAVAAAKDALQEKVTELEASNAALDRQRRDYQDLAEQERGLNDRLSQEVAIKNRFFSIIAHDLRSPFMAILGISELIERQGAIMSKDQLLTFAGHIGQSGKTVYELLDNLLEWARLQMEVARINPRPIDLAAVAEETLQVLHAPAEAKGVTLTTSVRDAVAFADWDMVMLVVRNLVANAIKFTPSGGSIDISAERSGALVEVRVRDTGIGVDPSIADKLFRIDVKTSTDGTDGETGTGLGLPLCREMVERNGGTIRVESVPDGGTVFAFTLPVAPGESDGGQ